MLISGNLHIYDVLWDFFKPEGIVIHVEKELFVYRKDDDFIYPQTDTFLDLEKEFEGRDVKDIIVYSPKFKQNQ
jgi:hypothetical protein